MIIDWSDNNLYEVSTTFNWTVSQKIDAKYKENSQKEIRAFEISSTEIK